MVIGSADHSKISDFVRKPIGQPVRPFMGQQQVGAARQTAVIVPQKMTELKDLPMKSYHEFEQQYGNDTEQICEDHESLI